MVTEQLSALEELALKGILELDINRSTGHYSFPGGGSYIVECVTKPDEVYKAAKTLVKESPNVVEEVARYFLDADDSHSLKSVRVVRAVSLLKEIGKSDEDIAQRVVESIKGETAYHTIEKYHIRLGNKYRRDGGDNLKENNPEMYGLVMNRLTQLITPNSVLEAIAGLRGKDGKYARGDLFNRLCQVRDNIQQVINDQNAPQRANLTGFIEAMKRSYDYRKLIFEKSSLVYDMLSDFWATLGGDEFKHRGYTFDGLYGEKGFNTDVSHICFEEIDKNIQRLTSELEQKKQPWYRKLFK